MTTRLLRLRYRWLFLVVLLLLDPLRCSVPQTSAAQFAPAIMITEGKSAQGYPCMMGGVGANDKTAPVPKLQQAYNKWREVKFGQHIIL